MIDHDRTRRSELILEFSLDSSRTLPRDPIALSLCSHRIAPYCTAASVRIASHRIDDLLTWRRIMLHKHNRFNVSHKRSNSTHVRTDQLSSISGALHCIALHFIEINKERIMN